MALITLAEAKTALNITDTTNDAELQTFVDAASQMWLSRGLPGGAVSRTEWCDGGSPRIVLRYTPIMSVTSISENVGPSVYTLTEQPLDGGTAGAFAFTVDLYTGVVTRRVAGSAVPFAAGVQNVKVVYQSGFSTVAEDIKLAIKLLVAHMWDTQRGGARRPGQGGNEWTPTQAFAWPNRVEEIAKAYQGPVTA